MTPTARTLCESDLILSAVTHMFPPRRWAVCDNVSWGFLTYEADAICVSPGGVVHELEAKSSKSDLLRDRRKQKWFKSAESDCFWYVVPADLKDVAVSLAKPLGFGVVVVTAPDRERHQVIGDCERVLQPRRRRVREGVGETGRYVDGAAKIRDRRNRIWRLASLRYWSDKMRVQA